MNNENYTKAPGDDGAWGYCNRSSGPDEDEIIRPDVDRGVHQNREAKNLHQLPEIQKMGRLETGT